MVAVAGLLLLLLVALLVFIARQRKRDPRTTPSPTPPADDPALDNWSIPRPQPRVWQTTASMMSSERRRIRRQYGDDDFVENLELRQQQSNGHAVQQRLHRTANGGLPFVEPDQSPPVTGAAGYGGEPSLSSRDQQPTPQLRRYVTVSELFGASNSDLT